MKPAALPVQLQPLNLRPLAYRVLLRKHGLNIQTDALQVLTDAVGARFGADWRGPAPAFLDSVGLAWRLQGRGLFLDGPGLAQVLRDMPSDSGGTEAAAVRTDTLVDEPDTAVDGPEAGLDWRDHVRFVAPDEQPVVEFDKVRRQLVARPRPAGPALKSALAAAHTYFSARQHLVMDRLSRHEQFHRLLFSSIAALNADGYEITAIKNVLGRDGSSFILCGLLATSASGDYTLEDSLDRIELSLAQARKTPGSFYTTGMFVLVEGIYSALGGHARDLVGGCFHVTSVGHPPAERRDAALEAYGHLDYLGVHAGNVDRPLRRKLAALEKTLPHRLVFLGCECHLDDAATLAALTRFFAQLEAQVEHDPTRWAVVMAGSFVARPLTAAAALALALETYKAAFDRFAELLARFPLVVRLVRLVLIPGPNDPWQLAHSLGRLRLNVLPQQPVPDVFVTRLERLLPKGRLVLGWNPMRVSFLSQEIVLFRDNIMDRLKRNDIEFEHTAPAEEPPLPAKTRQARQLVKTLLDQGTLQPFLKDMRVVNPAYLHVLRLEPLPTTLLLMDAHFENFEITYNGCKVANLGPLRPNISKRTLNYAEYTPAAKKYTFKTVDF